METISKRFQQTQFWADFKCNHGWKSVRKDNVSVLYRTFSLGFMKFSIAYVPLAPEKKDSESMEDFIKRIFDFSSDIISSLPKNTLCVRFDIPIDFDDVQSRDGSVREICGIAKAERFSLYKTKVDVQPPDSVVLDLSKSEEELLSSMKAKWRYNIRYASKHGVIVRAVSAGSGSFERDLESFYELYKTTAARDGIGIHPLSYYRDLIERSDDGTKITLYMASHEGSDLAAIITLFNKDEAIYLYGCSGNEKRNLMPAYLVQWTAICDAKQFGSKIYDFYGIPPTGDVAHPMHGLYLFKTGFGGKEVHRPGSFDVPFSILYRFYTFAEDFRAWYHKKFMKKIRGR